MTISSGSETSEVMEEVLRYLEKKEAEVEGKRGVDELLDAQMRAGMHSKGEESDEDLQAVLDAGKEKGDPTKMQFDLKEQAATVSSDLATHNCEAPTSCSDTLLPEASGKEASGIHDTTSQSIMKCDDILSGNPQVNLETATMYPDKIKRKKNTTIQSIMKCNDNISKEANANLVGKETSGIHDTTFQPTMKSEVDISKDLYANGDLYCENHADMKTATESSDKEKNIDKQRHISGEEASGVQDTTIQSNKKCDIDIHKDLAMLQLALQAGRDYLVDPAFRSHRKQLHANVVDLERQIAECISR